VRGVEGEAENANFRDSSSGLPLAPTTVAAGVGVGLAVAVWTQEHEVLEAVVVPFAIDVMKGERERVALPVDQPTALAHVLLEALFDQSSLDVVARTIRARDEQFRKY
jgi:hypothetical protein